MRVWDVLKERKGREFAITAKQLGSIIGMSEREVRAEVSNLRRRGYPIASATRPPYGFFVPVSVEEARECQAQLYSRMREIGITARALDHAFGEHLPSKQLVLDLFGSEGMRKRGEL